MAVSRIFTTNKRPDCLMKTAYLDACCAVLEKKLEYASDVYLINLVRIQKLAQAISMTLSSDPPHLQALQLPVTMVIQSFQQQLDAYKSSLSPCMRAKRKHVSIPTQTCL